MNGNSQTFFENHSLLDPNQGGFRINNSTINSIANCLDNIYEAINDKQLSLAVYVNFSKAFDTVNHQILLKQLHHIAIKKKDPCFGSKAT